MDEMVYRYLMAFGLMLFASSQPQAAVYQWTDENGRVHFSDRPVGENATEKSIRTTPGNKSDRSIQEDRKLKRQRMLEVYRQEREEKREATAKDKEAREERRRRCVNARVDYENYRGAGVIYEMDENGERTYLDKGQREEYLARLKAKAEEYCD